MTLDKQERVLSNQPLLTCLDGIIFILSAPYVSYYDNKMNDNERFKKVKSELDEVSPSFCLAKWLQVTVHLQNGMNHSCHHPIPHKIPLEEIKQNPSALHNTTFKKLQRKKMLEGVRPKECDYCWRIEDAHPDNFSDRMVKSADSWALPYKESVAKSDWEADIAPTYLEMSFGNECQFKCAYCSPVVSSAILSESLKHGHYKVQSYFSLDYLKEINQYPYSKDEFNPYVDAFWKWWPDLTKTLKTFRITGGEPLLNPNTFQFLEKVIANPMPELDVAINSNLCVPDIFIEKFLTLSKKVTEQKSVKRFEIYTSLDTFGLQSEYIRFGLDSEKFFNNVRKVLNALPETHLIFMCTFNVLSVPQFDKFILQIADLKKEFPHFDNSHSRVQLSISYLRHPEFMAANILPKEDYLHFTERALDTMLRSAQSGEMEVFREYEIGQLRRILEWLKNDKLPDTLISYHRKNFYNYFVEYDSRKGTSLRKTFPELGKFLNSIEVLIAAEA